MVSYDGEELTKGSWTPEVSLGLAALRACGCWVLVGVLWRPSFYCLCRCCYGCFLQEDEALRKQVARLGPRNWSLIAKAIPGRSGKSCRLR